MVLDLGTKSNVVRAVVFSILALPFAMLYSAHHNLYLFYAINLYYLVFVPVLLYAYSAKQIFGEDGAFDLFVFIFLIVHVVYSVALLFLSLGAVIARLFLSEGIEQGVFSEGFIIGFVGLVFMYFIFYGVALLYYNTMRFFSYQKIDKDIGSFFQKNKALRTAAKIIVFLGYLLGLSVAYAVFSDYKPQGWFDFTGLLMAMWAFTVILILTISLVSTYLLNKYGLEND